MHGFLVIQCSLYCTVQYTGQVNVLQGTRTNSETLCRFYIFRVKTCPPKNLVNLGKSLTYHGPNRPDYKYKDTIFLRGQFLM